MENWNKITTSRVVNIFRNITHECWGLDVHFYDKFGVSQNKGLQFQNPLCSLIHSNKKTAEECLLFRKCNFRGLNGPHKTFVCNFYENLKLIAVPITVKDNIIGSMVCSGLQFPITGEQKEESIRRLTKLGFPETELLMRYNRIKMSDSLTEKYVLRFMKMVIKDISSWCKILFDEDGIKKEQALLIDLKHQGKYKNIFGTSIPMKEIINRLHLIENSESPVLILGETGTGKELIATAIHYNSVRKDKPFVIQNCSAFSDTILSSELFGHEKGAFTGAVSEKKGIFEIANRGTLFLDEIGDLSINVQGKLLRVLENGTFYRVGGTVEREVDVRIITATNKNLLEMVEKGLFRRDLLFRINTIRIKIPPLRERRDDIKPLFFKFLIHYMKEKDIGKKILNPDLIKILIEHDWKGNVRELKNSVESLVTMSSKSATIEPEHLHLEGANTDPSGSLKSNHDKSNKLRDVVSSTDMVMVRNALQKANWNKTRASRILGISRASLIRRIEKYSISKEKRKTNNGFVT
ncbi:MAG: sigma 54-interacting transcriptional regulator [Candidatus Scalindua sp.]|nr:sigma 54-interacting transcriptional regulator [Candidatus Scalindua sp.]